MRNLLLFILFAPILVLGQAQVESEDFETTGIPAGWAVSGGSVDWDETTLTIANEQSLQIPDGNTNGVIGRGRVAYDSCWVFLKMARTKTSGTGGTYSLRIYQEDGSTLTFYIFMNNPGTMHMRNCGVNSSTTTVFMDSMVTYYVWYFYALGTGADSRSSLYIQTADSYDGDLPAELGTTDEDLVHQTNGGGTTTAGCIGLFGPTGLDLLFDDIYMTHDEPYMPPLLSYEFLEDSIVVKDATIATRDATITTLNTQVKQRSSNLMRIR
jgi:hypothetical protein